MAREVPSRSAVPLTRRTLRPEAGAALSRHGTEERERVLFAVVVVGFVLALALAVFLGWSLARRVMAPVVRLARQVRHRDQLLGLAPPLAPDYAADEVGELAVAKDWSDQREKMHLEVGIAKRMNVTKE